MTAAARVLGWALVGLYDETLLMLRATLAWFLVSLPLGAPALLVLIALLPSGLGQTDAGAAALPLVPYLIAGLLLLLVPNPASLGLYRLAATMQRRESPPWGQFWEGT